MSNDISAIAAALSKAQASIVSAKKDKKGYGYKYAELSTVQDAIKEPFAENELSYTHIIQDDILRCILMHTSGQWLASDYPIQAEASKNMNINQARGSAITYGRRYTLAGIAGIPQEDDDGRGSAPEYVKPAPAPKPVQKAAPKPPADNRRQKMMDLFTKFEGELMLAETVEQKTAYFAKKDFDDLRKYAGENAKFKTHLNATLVANSMEVL